MKLLKRAIPWTEDHIAFREMARDFCVNELEPHVETWNQDRIVPRDVWEKTGALGLLCPDFPEEYGGAGCDFLFNTIAIEEISRVGASSGFFHNLHTNIVAPYFSDYCTAEQKKRWLPDIAAGKKILAVAMTEPNTGSDLAAITTTAIDQGDFYLVNGAKTFISNGYLSDLVVVVVKTNMDRGIHGTSLLVIERGMEGFERGRKLDKIGMHAQDTAELFFNDVKVPKENLLGKAGHGFRYLMKQLQQERVAVAIDNMAGAEVILENTIKYVKERKAFGQAISKFQNTRFKLAEMATEQASARAFMDQVILAHTRGDSAMVQASQAKLLCSEIVKRHVDECLQFYGGYGYMMEYPIARSYIDSRVQTIYAGTSEIMKEIIASSGLGL